MDRPKHRWFVVFALVLLAGGALWLLGGNRAPAPPSVPALTATATATATKQVVEPKSAKVEPTATEAAAPKLELPPSGSSSDLRGRIIDAITREPIKEFEVQLIRLRPEAYTEDEPITRSFATSAGRFTWTDLAAGTWRAAISAPGYQMFNVPDMQIPQAASSNEIVVPLVRGFAIRGRVFELSTGAGIVDAFISFRQLDNLQTFDKSRAQTRSKEDGSFKLDGIPGGDIVLMVGARNHAHRELKVFVDKDTPSQDIALSTGATIAGIVTTTAGARVAGHVSLQGPSLGYSIETDSTGRFFFHHMPAGRYRLSVDTSTGGATRELMLDQDEVQDITLIVGAGRSVRGTLSGLPAEQLQTAQILLQSMSEGTSHTARPNERGAYVLNGVPSGQALMTVLAEGLQLERQVDVPADRDVVVDIAFPAGARLTGRVSRGGRPAANWDIVMSPVDRKSHVVYRVRTSEDGNYAIEGLAPGDYRLRADQDISRAVTIAGDVVLNIDIPDVQISARVMEEGAIPIVGANVHVRGSAPETARVFADEKTNDFGRFVLTGLEPGEIVLIVYKSGYELHREQFVYSSPIKDRTITLRKSAGVEVAVRAGSRRFPRGFTLTQSFAGNPYVVDLWMPMDREGLCHVPSALAGTTFQIGRFSGEPIVIKEWDGQPFDLP
jgi:hypothetical protein